MSLYYAIVPLMHEHKAVKILGRSNTGPRGPHVWVADWLAQFLFFVVYLKLKKILTQFCANKFMLINIL